MRLATSILRICAALVVLALAWAYLFGDGMLTWHFATPAYATPFPGAHPYHLHDTIVYVSDSELWFLRAFTWGLPIAAFLLGMAVFSGLEHKRRRTAAEES